MKVFIFLYCQLNIDNDNCQINIDNDNCQMNIANGNI